MAGGNSHQRAIERAAKERMVKEVSDAVDKALARKAISTVAQQEPSKTPWYERNLFWGFLASFLAVLLVVVASRWKDLRWLLIPAWPLAIFLAWLACKEIRNRLIKWSAFSVVSVLAGLGLLFIGLRAPKPEVSIAQPISPPTDLTGIQKTLREMNQHLSAMGRPAVTSSQVEAIKEVEEFLIGRDESSLREIFGFPLMMEKNVRMNIIAISHYKKGTPFTSETMQANSIGTEMLLDSELAEGRIRRHGGGFLQTPMDGTNIYALMLPDQYTEGKKKLLKFESSPELPSSITKEIKGFDESVYKNADNLLHVLNSALKKDPNYFLRYDDVSSAEYFHQIDAMWLDHFIQLEPQANRVRDAIRKVLAVN